MTVKGPRRNNNLARRVMCATKPASPAKRLVFLPHFVAVITLDSFASRSRGVLRLGDDPQREQVVRRLSAAGTTCSAVTLLAGAALAPMRRREVVDAP